MAKKWVYIKNGNVVEQLRRLSAEPDHAPEAGPDAFLGDFLHGIADDKVMLLSWCTTQEKISDQKVSAITYRVSGSTMGRLGNAFLRLKAVLAGAKIVLAYKPERIICGRVGLMLLASVLLGRWLKCPVIHSRHNSLYEGVAKWYQRLMNHIDRWAILKTNAVICHGPFLVQQMEQLGVHKDRIYEFDVGFERFYSAFKRSVSSETNRKERIILYVGRMEETKGIFDLLNATLPIMKQHPDIYLQYIGDGPDLDRLKKLAVQKSVSNKVIFSGKIKHDELPRMIASSFMMVTPTQKVFPEGRCMAAMESLACGIPVIAPNHGPFPFLVEADINGLLFKSDDIESLNHAIISMVESRDLYSKLKKGAETSAKALRTPVRTFYQAVVDAFK